MFKKRSENQITNSREEVQTIIGSGVEVKGDFEGEGDIIVEGKVSGSLKTKNNLRIGPGANIEADIEGENIYVAGNIKGNIKAINELELSESANINGDISAKSLLVERGACFNGHSQMTENINNKKKNKIEIKGSENRKEPMLVDSEALKIEVSETE